MNTILILGCGNMGGAMLAGWLGGGVAPSCVTVVDPALAEAPAGVRLLRELPDEAFDTVLLGVKPQLLDDVAPRLAAVLGSGTTLLSILAGVELDSLAARFPGAGALVRVMPNLAAAIGKSPIALFGRGLDQAGRDAVSALMQPLGQPEWLAAESDFDLVTALAGSGPGFVYRFIEALAEVRAPWGWTRRRPSGWRWPRSKARRCWPQPRRMAPANWRGGWPARAARPRRGSMCSTRTGHCCG